MQKEKYGSLTSNGLRGMIESVPTPNSTPARMNELQAVLVVAPCNYRSSTGG